MNNNQTRENVIDANVKYHTAHSATYHLQPHFKPENRVLFTEKLKKFSKKCGNELLVDLGCGTGFVIELATSHFSNVVGVDITPAMLKKVDRSLDNSSLIQADTEYIPLVGNIANVVTSNSYLHHLWDIEVTVKEAFRLLKNGGVFFCEEDPNALYWDLFDKKNLTEIEEYGNASEIIMRELSTVVNAHKNMGDETNTNPDLVKLAEYQKMVKGGMREKELERIFLTVGFKEVKIEYYWFIGQSHLSSQNRNNEIQIIEEYLRMLFPLTKNLFKYLRMEAWK